jgi:hypothetical protein
MRETRGSRRAPSNLPADPGTPPDIALRKERRKEAARRKAEKSEGNSPHHSHPIQVLIPKPSKTQLLSLAVKLLD